jgi:hypothetical protein
MKQLTLWSPFQITIKMFIDHGCCLAGVTNNHFIGNKYYLYFHVTKIEKIPNTSLFRFFLTGTSAGGGFGFHSDLIKK